jgi:diaminopimelate epimerase
MGPLSRVGAGRVDQPLVPGTYRGNALHPARRIRKRYVLIGDGDEPRGHGGDELAGAQQEIGVRWPPKVLMADRERLVDEEAVGRDDGNNVWKNGAPQVVGDDHAIENLVCKGKGLRGLEVGTHQLDRVQRAQVLHTVEIAVDTDDPVPVLEGQPQVTPAAARDIEDAPAWTNTRQEPLNPSRRGAASVRSDRLPSHRRLVAIAFWVASPIYGAMTIGDAIPFRKMNGLGNAIVMVDLRGTSRIFSPAEARTVAASPRTHFDQLMVLHDPKTKGTDAFLRIYNADGSEAGACGNGTRCVAWVVAQQTGRSDLSFETGAGLLDVHVDNRSRITVDMGEPRFQWSEIPLAEPFHDTRKIELQIGPLDKPLLHSPSVVNVGNPHAIFWVDSVDAYDLRSIGPMLESHPIFPERANISLAHVASRESLMLRTWERGAGLTKACGSAACAAAVSAARTGRTERKVTVLLPGGPLHIEWTASNRILMTGPAELEYEGWIDPRALAEAAAAP